MSDALEPAQLIEAKSFEIIASLLPDFDQSTSSWPIVRRIVHTTGDPSIAKCIRFQTEAISAGLQALRQGRLIITDVKMVSAGISRRLTARLGCEVVCAIDDPAVCALARERKITRSAAAMLSLSSKVPGAVVAIGNAPTALFTLLDSIEHGLEPPALIVGTPVGFVGAAEAKAKLIEYAHPRLPYITVEGTRGGSAIAASVVNALLRMAVEGAA